VGNRREVCLVCEGHTDKSAVRNPGNGGRSTRFLIFVASAFLAVAPAAQSAVPFRRGFFDLTPSPEMVAALPEARLLSLAMVTACMLGFLVSIFLIVLFSGKGQLPRVVPLEISPAALADRAKTMIKTLGYAEAPVDFTYGIGRRDDYLRYIAGNDPSPDPWKRLHTGRPPVLYFWYRQSPVHLVPASQGRVTADDPPPVTPNMIRIILDTNGRLLEFGAVSSIVGSRGDAPPSNAWGPLFDAARLDMNRFDPIASDFTPPVSSDERAAWEGTSLDDPMTKLRVHAAAYRGRPFTSAYSAPGPTSRAETRNTLLRCDGQAMRLGRRADSSLCFHLLLS
jgi:hypothetical protein